MKNIIIFLFISLISFPVFSQQLPVSSTNLSSTIQTTNTFQSIQSVNGGRSGCTIQNNGSHSMYVYFGTCANATTSNSIILGPAANSNGGQTATCSSGGNTVLKDTVCITGNSGDAFFANFQ